jgi:imidazolonepropionase-like amidohydrolase
MAGKTYDTGCKQITETIISKIAEKITPSGNESVIDAKGCWVLPGLVESHCHIGITEEKTGLEGDDCNETTEPITPYLKAIDAINPMDAAFHSAIKAGITSVMAGPGSSNVVGGQFAFLNTDGRCLDDMIVLEPAAMKRARRKSQEKLRQQQRSGPSLSTRRISWALRTAIYHMPGGVLNTEIGGGDAVYMKGTVNRVGTIVLADEFIEELKGL